MRRFDDYLGEIAKVRQALDARIIGQSDLKGSLITCFLSGGLSREENSHILIRSVPGLGKTGVVKTFAKAFSVEFRRIQFKIDEMPKDFFFRYRQIPETGAWVRENGAMFSNILLLDEINRAHPDTHSGLLEAMAEGQFTEEGETFEIPKLFMGIGTFNPVEQRGTYAFLEALKDRFTMQVDIHYPTPAEQRKITDMHEYGAFPETEPVMSACRVFEIRRIIQDKVEITERVKKFIEECVEASRPENNPELVGRVKLGLSPRGNIWLTRVAKTRAFLEGRHYVIPRDLDDKTVRHVLAHRLLLSDELTITMNPIELEKETDDVVSAITKKARAYAKA